MIDKVLERFGRSRFPRLEFGELRRNEHGTYFLKIKKVSGEGSAHRCSARIVCKELELDHFTVWNIKPYPREYNIQDYADIVLFTYRKDPWMNAFAMRKKGNFLTFYQAKVSEGFDEKEAPLNTPEDQVYLEIALNVENGKVSKTYRESISKILSRVDSTKSVGDLGSTQFL